MIKKTRYLMKWYEKKWRITYRQRLAWRIAAALDLARIDIEVEIDHYGWKNNLLSEVLATFNRIDKLRKRWRVL